MFAHSERLSGGFDLVTPLDAEKRTLPSRHRTPSVPLVLGRELRVPSREELAVSALDMAMQPVARSALAGPASLIAADFASSVPPLQEPAAHHVSGLLLSQQLHCLSPFVPIGCKVTGSTISKTSS